MLVGAVLIARDTHAIDGEKSSRVFRVVEKRGQLPEWVVFVEFRLARFFVQIWFRALADLPGDDLSAYCETSCCFFPAFCLPQLLFIAQLGDDHPMNGDGLCEHFSGFAKVID